MLSICASAASSSGVMVSVEYLRKSGPYCCQVSARHLVERPADEKEQLGRLADHLIDDVCQREYREDRRYGESDPNRRRYSGQFPSRPPGASPAANGTKKGVPALPDAFLTNAGLGGVRQGHGDGQPVVRWHATPRHDAAGATKITVPVPALRIGSYEARQVQAHGELNGPAGNERFERSKSKLD